MGWMELLVVGVVALIVVGPKDLPVMFHALGKVTAKLRRMAREFSSAMNDAAQASGASDIGKDLKGMTSAKNLGLDKLKEAADSFDKWEPGQGQKAMGAETAKLAQERAAQAKVIREKAADMAQARLDREAAAAQEAAAPKVAAATATAKKPATKTPAAKKPAPKKPAAKTAAKTPKAKS